MKLFDINSKPMALLSTIFDLIFLNILFVISCIPVVTIGAAVSALYKVTMEIVTSSGGGITASYFKGLKENIKKSTVMWMLTAVLLVISVLDIRLWLVQTAGELRTICITLSVIIVAVILMCCLWAFPIASKFNNTVKGNLKNSLLFSLRYFPQTILLTAGTIGWYFLLLWFQELWVFIPLIAFSLSAYLKSFYIYKKIKVYAEPDENCEQLEEKIFSDN